MRRSSLAAAVGFVALAAGCSPGQSPKLATVSGRVTFKGEPLPGGRLTVKALAPDAQVQQTYLAFGSDGTFILTEAPVGPVAVSIDTEIVKNELIPAQQAGGGPVTYRYVPIPKKYANPETAGLGFAIQPGQQTHDFQLEP